MFQDLIAGDVDRAVIPVESYYTKRIRILYDIMVQHDLHIVDEVFLNITHTLLGLEGSKLQDIKNIVSHPQVGHSNTSRAQCRESQLL